MCWLISSSALLDPLEHKAFEVPRLLDRRPFFSDVDVLETGTVEQVQEVEHREPDLVRGGPLDSVDWNSRHIKPALRARCQWWWRRRVRAVLRRSIRLPSVYSRGSYINWVLISREPILIGADVRLLSLRSILPVPSRCCRLERLELDIQCANLLSASIINLLT